MDIPHYGTRKVNKRKNIDLLPLLTLLLIAVLIQSKPLIAKDIPIEKIMNFKHFSVNDGLSHSDVIDIVQDKQGFIWLSTDYGLNRYDGYTSKVYSNSKETPNLLSSNRIKTSYIDSSGHLWLGTDKGLDLFNPLDGTFEKINFNGSEHMVKVIYEDSEHHLWIGTNKGLFRQNRDHKTFDRYQNPLPEAEKLASAYITSVIEDDKGRLWIGTNKYGVYRFSTDKKQLAHYQHKSDNLAGISANNINSIYETSQHEIWIATNDGLNKYDDEHDSFVRFIHDPNDTTSLSANMNYCLFEDSLGVLWVGTGHGLSKFEPNTNTFTRFYHDPTNVKSLSNNIILSIYEDKYGFLWIGTAGGGANIFDRVPQAFAGYQSVGNDNNLSQKYTVSIYEDNAGTLWLSGDGELTGLNRETSQYINYKHNPLIKTSLGKGRIYAIHEDGNNQLWMGSFFSGLSHMDRESGQFNYYRPDEKLNDGLTFKTVVSIHEYKNEVDDVVLWLGTETGLWQFNTETKRFNHFPIGEKANYTFSIVNDGEERLWVSTYNEGFFHVNKKDGSFTQYHHDDNDMNSLSSDIVIAIIPAANDHLWIATTEGLDHFDTKTKRFSHYNIHNGLPNNNIYSILQDDDKNIWVSTNKGLSRLDVTSNQFENFDVNDGLQSNEFNLSSSHKTKNGELYFGGINGFNAFFPDQLLEHKIKPDIVITDFSLFNESVSISTAEKESPLTNTIETTKDITLTHLDYVFSIDFAAIHFGDPMQNQYMYQLEGFDNNWIKSNAKLRHATYTNLPSGDYIFRVKGSNKDNVWSDSSSVINIKILPAPWFTWWAFLLYIIVIGSILGIFFYRRYQHYLFKLKIAEKIKISEERLSMALWGSGDQFWDFNIASGEVNRINVLDGFATPEHITLKNINELVDNVHQDDQASLLALIKNSVEGKTDIFEFAYRLKNINQQWIWVMNKGRVVSRDNNGKTLRMAGVLINVHELYETQSQLKLLNQNLEDKVKQRTKELQESIDILKDTQQKLVQSEKMAALGDLVAGFAHEVNTPLGICVTILSLQLDTLKNLKEQYSTGELTAEDIEVYMNKSDEQLLVAQRNTNRAATLIKSFKQVAVDQSHEVVTNIDMKDYIEMIISSNSPKIKQAKIRVNLIIPDNLKFKTYPGAWAQIVTNLIDNSIAHAFTDISREAEITIEVERNKHIELIYTDNGVGMTQEVSTRVFEPFYTTKRGQGGTGLGMHIVYNLVTQKLKGTIDCTSRPNEGVSFIIECDQL